MAATLTPEEIKALMSAIQDGRVNTEATAKAHRSEVVAYDLTSQDRIIRGQMPTLDAINEQVASMLGIGLAGRTRVSLRVTSSPATLLKFADLVPLLAPPASVCVLGLGSSYGFALAVLEPGLAEALLAAALGDRRLRAPDGASESRRELALAARGEGRPVPLEVRQRRADDLAELTARAGHDRDGAPGTGPGREQAPGRERLVVGVRVDREQAAGRRTTARGIPAHGNHGRPLLSRSTRIRRASPWRTRGHARTGRG